MAAIVLSAALIRADSMALVVSQGAQGSTDSVPWSQLGANWTVLPRISVRPQRMDSSYC